MKFGRWVSPVLVLSTICTTPDLWAGSEPAPAGASLAQKLPADTLLYATVDTHQVVNQGLSLDLVTLLDEPDVQAFLSPMQEEIPFLSTSALRNVIENSPVWDYVRGNVELAVRGASVTINGKTYEVNASTPITARLINRFIGLGAEISANVERGLGWSGEVTIAPDFVLSLQAGPQLVEVMQQIVHEGNGRWSKARIGNQEVDRISFVMEDEIPGATVEIYRVRRGDRWLIGGNPKTLALCMGQSSGKSLAQSHAFQNFKRSASNGNPAVMVYTNVKQICGIFQGFVAPIVQEEMEILGLTSIEAAGFASSFVNGGVRDTFAVTYGESPKGLLSLLNCTQGGLDFIKHAPVDTGVYFGAKCDVERMLDRFVKVMDETFPGSSQAVELAFAELNEEAGMNVRENVLPAFGTEVGLYLTAPRASFLPGGMFLVEVGDRDRFDRLLARAKIEAGNEGIQFSDLSGLPEHFTGFSMRIPDVPIQPAVAVGDDYLAVCIDPLSLRQNLKAMQNGPAESSVTDSESFRKVMEGLGGNEADLSFLAFADLRGACEVCYQFLPMAAGAVSAETDGRLDLALLPESHVISRHFSGIGIAGQSDDAGISFSVFSPLGVPSAMIAGMVAAAIEEQGHGGWVEHHEIKQTDHGHDDEATRKPAEVSAAKESKQKGRSLSDLFSSIELATGATIQYPVKLGDITVSYAPTTADLETMMSQLSALAGFNYQIKHLSGDSLVVITAN